MSNADVAANYVFVFNRIDYCGITADNQLHYRGNPSTRCSIPAVLPQDLRENPRYYRDYRGITDVPITVHLSIWNEVVWVSEWVEFNAPSEWPDTMQVI